MKGSFNTVKVARKDIIASGFFENFGRSVCVNRYTFDPPIFEEDNGKGSSRED